MFLKIEIKSETELELELHAPPLEKNLDELDATCCSAAHAETEGESVVQLFAADAAAPYAIA
ncbi:MAG TPA: hypothetical protein VIK47_04335 [Kiloniellales bacterium]